jgi:peroxiredoxin
MFKEEFMRFVRILFLSCVLTTATVAMSFAMANPGYIGSTLIGKPAADFTLNTLREQNVNMTKYRDGKKAIIFFWATWCPHCRTELKRLAEIHKDIEAKGIKLIIISVGEQRDTVQAYIDRHQYPFDVFLDEDQALEESYRIVGVPTLFFIDENGVIKLMDHALPEDIEAPFQTTKN